MEKKIDLLHIIDKTALHSDRYFASLTEEAYSCGMLADADIERIRGELYLLLGNICKGIAEKGTSSIKIDTAEEISESVMYTLSVRLKKCENPDEAVKLLQSEKLADLFEQGRKELFEKLINTKAKWTVLQRKLFKTESKSFNETIVDAMKAFFANYDYKLYAHKSIILFDYPVYNDSEKLTGVEFVSGKLDYFIIENSFLNKFDCDAVCELLCLLDDVFGGGKGGDLPFYFEAPVNLYFYVFACALGLEICGKEPFGLKIEEDDLFFIESRLSKKNYADVLLVLSSAAQKLICELELDKETSDYLNQSVRKLAGEIALSFGLNIRTIFLCKNNKRISEKITLESVPQMSDTDFRFLLSQLKQQKSIGSVAELIGENIKNETDFEEAVKALRLQRTEIAKCIEKLENPGLILLLKKHLSSKPDEESRPVFEAVKEYFHCLSDGEKQQIKSIIKAVMTNE